MSQAPAIRESFFTLILKVITDSGPTAPITPLCRSSIFLRWRAQALSKAPFAGGRAVIGRTTGEDACHREKAKILLVNC